MVRKLLNLSKEKVIILLIVFIIIRIRCEFSSSQLNFEIDEILYQMYETTSPHEQEDCEEELDDMIFQKNIYTSGIVVSIVGCIICTIIIANPKQKEQNNVPETQLNNKTSQDKLYELQSLLNQNLITQEEFDEKRKEIINNL